MCGHSSDIIFNMSKLVYTCIICFVWKMMESEEEEESSFILTG